MGSVVRIRETWRQLAPLSPQEASRVMLEALQHSGSLAAVREIDSLWDRAVHKDWASLAVSDSSGRWVGWGALRGAWGMCGGSWGWGGAGG